MKSYTITGDAQVHETKTAIEITIQKEANIELKKKSKKEIQINAKPGSKGEITDTSNTKRVKITIEAATMNYTEIIDTTTEHESQKQITVKKDAKITFNEIIKNAQFLKQKTNIDLEGKNATAIQNIVYQAKKKEEWNIKAVINHNREETRSNLNIKGTIDDHARVHMQGNIHMNKRGCIGIQKGRVLLLSKNAKINATPVLEIANNQIQCTHATTITRIDEDKIYYMMSRGLTREQAKEKISKGFCELNKEEQQ